MGGTYGTHGGEDKCVRGFDGKSERKEDRGVYERMALKYVLKEDSNVGIVGSRTSLMVMCHLCIDECQTGGNIQ